MLNFYDGTLKFFIKHRLIYISVVIIVWALFVHQLPSLRFDMSETLWLSGGEINEETDVKRFTVLAFEVKGADISPDDAANVVIEAMKDMKGVSDLSNGRIISGLSKRLKSDVGVVTFQSDLTQGTNINEFDKQLHDRLAQFKWIGRYHYLGKNVLNAELINLTREDMLRLLPWVFIICLAITLLLYKNIFVALLPVINIFLTLIGALTVYMHMGLPVTITATILPPLILVLCLNDSIYTLNAFIKGKDELFRILPSCLQTGIVLIIGFIAMMFSNYQPIYYLGVMGILAVMFSLFSALLVLPVMFSFMGQSNRIGTNWINERSWRAFYGFIFRRKKLLLILLLTVTVGIVVMLKETRLGANAVQYFRSQNKLTRSLDFFIENGLPVDRIALYIKPNKGTDIEKDKLEDWTNRIASRHKVIGTISQLDFLNVDLFSIVLSPEKAEYFRDMSKKYFPDRLGRIRIDIFEQFTSTEDAKKFSDWFNGWFLPQNRGCSTEFTGGAYLSWMIETKHAINQLHGFLFAMGIISLLFIALFGFKIGVLATAENCWPILATIALVNILGIHLNFVTILIANLVIGLAAEDTFYLLNRYKSLKRNNSNTVDAFSESTAQLGNSTVFSSVIMATGFALLGLSNFNPTFQLGLMATFAIIAALFADLVILPLLLEQFDK